MTPSDDKTDAAQPRTTPSADRASELGSPFGYNLTSIVASTVRYAHAQGIDLSDITAATNLERFQLLDHEARLSDELPAQIWNLIASRAGDGPLPLHMARATPLSIFGPYIYVVRYAPDLRDAIEAMIRFRSILASRLEIEWTETDDEVRVRAVHPSDSLDQGLMAELGFAMMYRLIVEELDCRHSIKRVELARGHGGQPQVYRDFFNVDVSYHGSTPTIVFHLDGLTRRTRDGDPTLFEYARQHLIDLEGRWNLGVPDDPLRQVRQAVHTAVERRRSSVEEVAQLLNMGPRSLQRLVASQGRTVRQLLDEARAARARDLLLNQSFDTLEIALRLGYSDERAFRRAFRRWTGLSPQEYRVR